MGKKFLKEITIKEMLFYLLQKCWIILVACVLAVIVSVIITRKGNDTQNVNVQQEEKYVLQEGNYVYATLLNVRAESTKEVVSAGTYLGLIISESSITAAIDELGLQESFIDIFEKMTWEVTGENIKLKISSPLPEIEGHSWKELLKAITNEGEKTIKEYYKNVIEVRVIDEPYIENALVKKSEKAEVSSDIFKPVVSKRSILLAVMIGGILSCAGILVVFLLREVIVTEKEIEENLEIPVLVIIDKKGFISHVIRR